MKQITLFLLLLFTNNLYSYDVDKYDTINSFLISENNLPYKNISYKEYKKKKVKNFTIKMGINKESLKNKHYFLSIVSDIKSLTYTNAKYRIKDHMMIIDLDENVEENLLFTYNYEKLKRGEFRFNVISDFEYNHILPYEGILYGLAYGIIFSAFLYYLVIFFSTFKNYFLYYSIMQFFVLLSLAGFTYVSFKAYPSDFEQAIIDIFETSGFLFTLLFAKEILDTKKQMPKMNYVLCFFIALNILDLIAILIFKYSILYEYMPFYVGFLIPIIAGIIAIFNKNKNAIFYTLGWLVLFCVVNFYEHDIIPLSGIYTIHLAAPMESLIFSFALAYMLRRLIKKQNEKEKVLIHKSKLASMGEMIDNIAHQWRQPLMHLGYINMNLEMTSLKQEFDKEYFIKKVKESNSQIKFMSKTIDDFRSFYEVNKTKELFLVSNACKLAINIISPTLKKKKITLNIEIKEDSNINGYENEYAQVILNFLTNCIDIFEVRKIENPAINILIERKNGKSITSVCDNARGIKKEHLNEVFKAHFSTKKRSSGIGLYMSQVIIQSHFNGNITVSNKPLGACFAIEV